MIQYNKKIKYSDAVEYLMCFVNSFNVVKETVEANDNEDDYTHGFRDAVSLIDTILLDSLQCDKGNMLLTDPMNDIVSQ